MQWTRWGSFVVAAVCGVAVVALALAVMPDEPASAWTLIGVSVLTGVVTAAVGSLVRSRIPRSPLAPTRPTPARPGMPTPWSFDVVAGDLAALLVDAPYRVSSGVGRIRIAVDEQDPRYWQALAHARPMIAQHWEIHADGSALRITEGVDGLVWPAQPGPPTRTGRMSTPSPTFVDLHESQHVAALPPTSRWRFTTAEVLAHLEPVAKRGDWRVRRSVRRTLRRLTHPGLREAR